MRRLIVIMLCGHIPMHAIAAEEKDVLDVAAYWEKCVEAKGGRARIADVSVLSMSSNLYRRLFGIPVLVGYAEDLYVLPFKQWRWGDERRVSSKFIPSVVVEQLDEGLKWFEYLGVSGPSPTTSVMSPSEKWSLRFSLAHFQHSVLLETTWVKPRLLSATLRHTAISCKVEVRAQLDDLFESFMEFDCKTNLLRRLTLTFGDPFTVKTNIPVGFVDEKTSQAKRLEYVEEYRDYKSVNGLLLPHSILTPRGYEDRVKYEINPGYSREIFKRPPTNNFGRYDWKLKDQTVDQQASQPAK